MNKRLCVLLSAVALVLLLFTSVSTAAGMDVGTETDTEADEVVAQEVEEKMETSEEPVEVLVNLEEAEEISVLSDRKNEVKQSQRRLLDYAQSTDGIRVLNSFWISNAVLLEVEPGFGHEALLDVENVESVRSNTEIEIMGTASSSTTTSPRRAFLPTLRSPGSSGNPSVSGGTFAGGSRNYGYGTVLAEPLSAVKTTSSSTYGVEQINAPDVWSTYGTKGGGVNVAVLDTGVNVSHPDIDLRTTDPSDPTYPGGWAEFDTQGNRVSGSRPYDSNGHGTHVTGTVGGDHTGVAPEANLMHGLIINGNTGTLSQALSGVEWAVEKDADVISMSLGGSTEDTWIEAVENANDMGVVVVSAVGNDGPGTSKSPGNVYDVIGVGAVDDNLNVAGFSGGEVIDTDATWGDSALAHWPSEYVVPDVVSAGVGVNSTSAGGGYSLSSGTSMATPHVAGAVALVESASGGDAVTETGNAFRFTAFGSGSDEPGTRYGYGAADALAATEFVIDDATVSGTVVDGSGSPIEEAELYVNDVHVDTDTGDYSVELAEGSWDFEVSAPGYEDTTETVSLSDGENIDVDVVLDEPDPAFFEVANLDGPSEAETDEETEVNATVTNTGDESGKQDVTLRIAESGENLDGSTPDKTRSDVTLDAGDSKTVEFTISAPSDGGDYDYGIFSDDDSATDSLTVEDIDPPFFEVINFDGPSESETDESIKITAKVTNTGDKEGTQDISYRRSLAGGALDSSTVVSEKTGFTLGAGNSRTVEFKLDAPSDEGDYAHGVFSDDDSGTGSLTVEDIQPASFDVRGLDGPSKAETGEGVTVTATITNMGDESGTQDLTLRVAEAGKALDGSAVEATESGVSLGGGMDTEVEFTVDAPREEGDYDYGVFSDDDSASDSLTVDDPDPPFFEVNDLNGPSEVEEGEDIKVNTTVTNTGYVDGTQEVMFRINATGEPLDKNATLSTESVNLAGGGNSLVEFEGMSVEMAGEYDYGVFTDNDSETASLTVEETLLFSVKLIRSFDSPPTNTGELDPDLYEDVNGDGDGTDPTQTVLWWSELVQNSDDFDDLTQEQVDALDWSGDGKLTPEDAVLLWSEQVQGG